MLRAQLLLVLVVGILAGSAVIAESGFLVDKSDKFEVLAKHYITEKTFAEPVTMFKGGDSGGELEWDDNNKVHWPKDTMCYIPGCVGHTNRWQLITHPSLNCWHCWHNWTWTEFLSNQAQAHVYSVQDRLIKLSGGILNERFVNSQLQKEALRQIAGLLAEVDTKGKGKQMYKGTDKDKGKDFGKGKSKGNNMKGNPNTDGKSKGKFGKKDKGSGKDWQERQGLWRQRLWRRCQQPNSIDCARVARWRQGCRCGRASSRKSTQQNQPSQQMTDDLALARNLEILIESAEGYSISLATLREGIGEKIPQKPQTILCGTNHEKASAVAKALRNRETSASALQEAQNVVDSLNDKYEADKVELRAKYDRFEIELDETFDKEVNVARIRRNTIAAEFDLAVEELDKAQQETMAFYNSLAASSQVPAKLVPIVNGMQVDGKGEAGEAQNKEEKSHTDSNRK